jgi:hypothetical protein
MALGLLSISGTSTCHPSKSFPLKRLVVVWEVQLSSVQKTVWTNTRLFNCSLLQVIVFHIIEFQIQDPINVSFSIDISSNIINLLDFSAYPPKPNQFVVPTTGDLKQNIVIIKT